MKTLCAWCDNIITPDNGHRGPNIYGICPDCADSYRLPRVSPSPPHRVPAPPAPPGGWLLFTWAVLLAGCVGFWYFVFLALSNLWDWAVEP